MALKETWWGWSWCTLLGATVMRGDDYGAVDEEGDFTGNYWSVPETFAERLSRGLLKLRNAGRKVLFILLGYFTSTF